MYIIAKHSLELEENNSSESNKLETLLPLSLHKAKGLYQIITRIRFEMFFKPCEKRISNLEDYYSSK